MCVMPKTDAEKRDEKNPRCPYCGKVGPMLETVPFDTGHGFFMITVYCMHCRKIITVNVLAGSLGPKEPVSNIIIPPSGVN